MSLTRRLLLLALISVLPAIVIWTYTEVSLRRAREAEVNDLAVRQAQLAAADVERIFENIRGLLLAVGEVRSVRAFDTPACVAYLASLQAKVPHLLAISAIDLQGRARCRHALISDDLRFNDRPYFKEAIASGEFVVGEYMQDRTLQRHVLPFALPVHDTDGQIIGVVTATLDLRWLGTQIGGRTIAEDASIAVADRGGVIIAREPFPDRFVGTRIPDAFRHLIHAAKPGALEVVSQDGTKRVLGYIPAGLQSNKLYVSVGLASKAAFNAINQAAKRGFMLIAAAFVLALSLAWLSGRVFVTEPFNIVADAVRAWRRGNYTERIALPRGSGELGLLADAFNDLVDDVARRQAALQESEERARLALEAGHMGAWWFDPSRRVNGWSPQASALVGLPPNTTSSALSAWRDRIHPDDLPEAKKRFKAALRGPGDYDSEFRVLHADGRYRWLNTRGRVFFDASGKPIHMVGVLQDVTARREAEERQRLLLDELNHRVKNTLATVQSIAAQTLRTSLDPAGFREAFESRLLALSKTHDLLTLNGWRDADFRAIAEQELAPYRREIDDRIAIAGPQVSLPSRAAINLGLVLHELVTNAAKYGALSTPQGRLVLKWSVEHDPDDDLLRLSLSWQEIGGPPVEPPTRQGFGSRLIQRSVEGELNGTVSLQFARTGVTCDIAIPLAAAGAQPRGRKPERRLAVAV